MLCELPSAGPVELEGVPPVLCRQGCVPSTLVNSQGCTVAWEEDRGKGGREEVIATARASGVEGLACLITRRVGLATSSPAPSHLDPLVQIRVRRRVPVVAAQIIVGQGRFKVTRPRERHFGRRGIRQQQR